MKTELKELAPYLPYGLKYQMQSDSIEDFGELIEGLPEGREEHFKEGSIWELCGYTGVNIPFILGEGEVDGLIFQHESGIWIGDNYTLKPILRPLSDIFKEIDEECRYFDELKSVSDGSNHEDGWLDHLADFYEKVHEVDFEQTPYRFIVQFLEWHFDVFGLIEKGLAIDINTL